MINNVTLMGRLTADPELRTTTTGRNVTSFSIAVDRSFARAGEDRQTDFINIVAWQQQADFVCRYLDCGNTLSLRTQDVNYVSHKSSAPNGRLFFTL